MFKSRLFWGNMVEETWDRLLEGVDPGSEAEQAKDTMPTIFQPRNKGRRPKGFNGMRSKMPSAIAIAFKKAGLDWKEDFALAIKNNRRDRIKLWLRLLPYMVATSSKAKVKRWKGRASRAALIALEALESE